MLIYKIHSRKKRLRKKELLSRLRSESDKAEGSIDQNRTSNYSHGFDSSSNSIAHFCDFESHKNLFDDCKRTKCKSVAE